MKQLTIILFLLLGLSLSSGAQNKIYYVKSSGIGIGTTWSSASGSLQQVIDKAQTGDQIYVAAGTYRGGFVMKGGVNVLGGFPANARNTTTLDDRKLPSTGQNLTILDGLNQMRVLTQDRAFSHETLWEGFVLQNGNATLVGTIVYNTTNAAEPAGIIFAYNATIQKAKMIALEQSAIMKWGAAGMTNAEDKYEGILNWITMDKYINAGKSWDDYPVWKYIKGLCDSRLGGYGDWYLPAVKELEEIYAQRHALNAVLKNSGKTEFSSSPYWGGSEGNSNSAWSVDFSYGIVYSNNKNSSCHARAVRALYNITDLTISQGGGAYLMAGGVLRNSVVRDCQASTIGGGAYLNGARMEGCVVEGCVAKEASAVYVGENAHLLSSTLVNNNVERTQAYEIMNVPIIGDYYYSNGTWGSDASGAIGIVCYIDPNNPLKGYILHKDENANTLSNWAACGEWATARGAGWGLSSNDVMIKVYENKEKLNSKLSQMGGTQLDNDAMYWTSNTNGNLGAWYFSFPHGDWYTSPKDVKYRARAARAF